MVTIKMDLEDYRDLCWKRLRHCGNVFNWNTESVEPFLDDIIECFEGGYAPSVDNFIDNLIVNGEHGTYDYFRNDDDETDEEVIKRLDPLYYNDEYLLVSA